jgi:hypothetical protein
LPIDGTTIAATADRGPGTVAYPTDSTSTSVVDPTTTTHRLWSHHSLLWVQSTPDIALHFHQLFASILKFWGLIIDGQIEFPIYLLGFVRLQKIGAYYRSLFFLTVLSGFLTIF